MERQLVSEEVMLLWLLRGNLKGETESKLIESQDVVGQTKYRATKILQQEADSKCRL